MDHDHLRAALDSSFGEGPPLPPATDRLAAGRRALRRRHSAAVTSAVVVVALVAGGAAASGRGGNAPRGADPAVAVPSVASPSETVLDDRGAEERRTLKAEHKQQQQERVSRQFPASFDEEGHLIVKDGWRVVQRVPNPMGYAAPQASLGVVVAHGDQTRWMLLYLEFAQDANGNPLPKSAGMGTGASADDPGTGYSRYEDWLASMVDLQGGAQTPELVVVSADDEVTGGPGVRLLSVDEVPVVADYTSPGDRVAEVRRDGRIWWVVIRGHGAAAETIPVDGDVVPGSTLDAFLSYLAQRASSGEGVR